MPSFRPMLVVSITFLVGCTSPISSTRSTHVPDLPPIEQGVEYEVRIRKRSNEFESYTGVIDRVDPDKIVMLNVDHFFGWSKPNSELIGSIPIYRDFRTVFQQTTESNIAKIEINSRDILCVRKLADIQSERVAESTEQNAEPELPITGF